MTWIRWETRAPDHELVGALAEALRVEPAHALGLYVAACCGFGEYRQDGDASQVTDTTLELWALWRGKRGAFAQVFRAVCVERREGQRDPVGVVRGWWRQRALLEKQRRDAARPASDRRGREGDSRAHDPPIPPASRPIPARESGGKMTGDVNGNGERTTHSLAVVSSSPPQRGARAVELAQHLADGDREAVLAFLGRLPDPDVEAARWLNYLAGQDFPAGYAPAPGQLATACRDYTGPYNPARFRAFVLRVVRDHRREQDRPSTRASPGRTARAIARLRGELAPEEGSS